jgi:hypothetical protein
MRGPDIRMMRYRADRVQPENGGEEDPRIFALAELVDRDGQTTYHLFTGDSYKKWRWQHGMLPEFHPPAHEMTGRLPDDIQRRIGPRGGGFKQSLIDSGVLNPEPPESPA